MEQLSEKQMKEIAILVEKEMAVYVKNEVAEMRKRTNDILANELEMTVAAMFLGRVIGRQHVETGEPLNKIHARCIENVHLHTDALMRKYIELLKNPGGKNGTRQPAQ